MNIESAFNHLIMFIEDEEEKHGSDKPITLGELKRLLVAARDSSPDCIDVSHAGCGYTIVEREFGTRAQGKRNDNSEFGTNAQGLQG